MENGDSVKFILLNKNGYVPSWGSCGSVGLDLRSAYDYVIKPFGWEKIETEISIETFPSECYARIAPRSGLALKGITVGAGVIDPDYTGPLGIVLFNHSNSTVFHVSAGDRVAQLIFEKCIFPKSVVVTCADQKIANLTRDLLQRERGDKGFGSSGLN